MLRRAVELGVNFIDTADSYGPYVSERLIRKALHPYPTVSSSRRRPVCCAPGPTNGRSLGFPAYLRQECEMSLRRLGVDTIDLFQLHRIDDKFPAEDQIGELVALQQEGKIRHIGLSEVNVEQLEAAQKVATDRVGAEHVQPHRPLRRAACSRPAKRRASGSSPGSRWRAGPLAAPGGPLQRIAADHDASPSQLALAWLLKRSPVMLPIPGTSKVAHLEENVAAAEIELSDEEFETLSNAASSG